MPTCRAPSLNRGQTWILASPPLRPMVEALFGFRVFGKMRRKNLHSDGTIKVGIAGTIHFSHPACA